MVRLCLGSDLVGFRYEQLFDYVQPSDNLDGAFRVVSADFVTTGDGTGIVSVPRKHMEDIFSLAETFSKDDDRAAIDIQNGLSFTKAMSKFSKI